MTTSSKQPAKDTKTRIMDSAERAIVQSGYGAFSFRDIAEEIGIKSASVHYHYPTKGDLAVAVMTRFTDEFRTLLPDPKLASIDPRAMLNGFIDGFKKKIVEQHNMSLCTMLTADKHLLPESVGVALAEFYEVKLSWLTQVFVRLNNFADDQARVKAGQLLASLHGASVLVQATGEVDWFEKALSLWR
ncbi:HTH-type transcriptional regulator TtgR [Marinomonas spartinae]|uniref:TetR/AcrR family transcriptional regulator n=1 Tax=Marinomonas spartinae TaxID=1792290 RepID=UPI00080906BC|nr:TetR/AcrR family transcriptional regulator [Marinomonas spartinae]SBS24647.1 HTH-type transcriptional regulator TtgR [Marinomonas spartinae]